MYEFIIGEVKRKKEDYVVLENNGIGFKIFTTTRILSLVNVHEEYCFYISFQMKEDGIYLYGFLEESELDMFNLLTTVSGVGPRSALSMLSVMPQYKVKHAIAHNDITALCQAQGIGKKTASRIILELHDKVDYLDTGVEEVSVQDLPSSENIQLAVEALQNLGFMHGDIDKVLVGMSQDIVEIEDIIKYCLKKLA